MDLREAERRILQVLALRPRSPKAFVISAPLGLPVEPWFGQLAQRIPQKNDLQVTVRLQQRRNPPAFFVFQQIAREIQKIYPDSWASVTEQTPLARPLRTPAPNLPREEGFRWIRHIAQTLAWFAVERPFKVFIYQLEHADPWSLETLKYLMDHLTTTPLQVFALWKPPPRVLSTSLAEGVLQGQIHLLSLELPPESALIQEWSARVSSPRALRTLVHLSGRRPLALRKLIQVHQETFRDQAIREWLATVPQILDHYDKAVLYLLQSFPDGLTPRELRSLLAIPAEETSKSLKLLEMMGLIFHDRGYIGPTVVQLSLPRPDPNLFQPDQVQRLRYSPVQKARVLEKLGFSSQAADYWIQAAEAELAQGHLPQALRYLDQASRLASDRLSILRKKLLWLLDYRKIDEVRQLVQTLNPEDPQEFMTLKEAEAGYRPISDLLQEVETYLKEHPQAPPEVRLVATRFALDLRDPLKARQYLETVKPSNLSSPKNQARYWDLKARYHTLMREFDQARRCYKRLQEITETLGHPYFLAVFYNNMAGFLLYQGDLEQARYYLDLSMETAGSVGLQGLYSVASMNQFLIYERGLRFHEARRVLFQTFRQPWFRHAPPHTRITALGNLVLVYFRLGEFEQAAHVYLGLHRHYLSSFPLLLTDPAETCIHALHALEGHTETIYRILQDFEEQAQKGDGFPLPHRLLIRYLQGVLRIEEGDPAAALAIYEEVLRKTDPQRFPYMALLVRTFQAEAMVLQGKLRSGRQQFNEVIQEASRQFPAEALYVRYLKIRSLCRQGEFPLHEIEQLERDLHKARAFGFARRVRALLPEHRA